MEQSAEAGWCVGCKTTRTSTGSVNTLRSSRFLSGKICRTCETRLQRAAEAAAGRAQPTAGTSAAGHGAAVPGHASKVGRPVLAPLSVNKMPRVQASHTPSNVTTQLQTPHAIAAGAAIAGVAGSPAGCCAWQWLSATKLESQCSLSSVHYMSENDVGGLGRLDTPSKVLTPTFSQHSPQTPMTMPRPNSMSDVTVPAPMRRTKPLERSVL